MFNFDDWGSWGVGDFYDGNEKELRDAIESKKTFDTGWHGFKKELESMRVKRNEDMSITVYVSEYMDSVFEEPDLIFDCLTSEEEEKITNEMIDEIQGILSDYWGFNDETDANETIRPESTYEDVIETAEKLCNECHETLHENYLTCMEVTLWVLYGHPDNMDFIKERVEKAR